MKKIAIILVFLACCAVSGLAQNTKNESKSKAELRAVLDNFMECFKKKDVEKFYSLFHKDPVVWVGIYKEKTQQTRVQKDAALRNRDFKSDGYKTFYKNLSKSGAEEKFSNIVIEEDGYIASITFDYSFWSKGAKRNWGKESWGLVKTNGQWKITSVIYSIEFESVEKEPQRSISEKIDSQIKKYVEKENFQGTVLVAQKGLIIHKAAYGFSDREKKFENTIETKFLIGSLTKSFTAVTVMQLVEAGLMDLNAPIKKYIPNLKNELAKDLTLHLLLKQQSGLAPSFDDLTDFANEDISSQELLQIINKTALSFAPGTKYEYSNLTYTLCALAIENVTGKSYAQVLQELTFTPLKMNNSGIERKSHKPANRAKGYRKNPSGIENDENVAAYALGAGDIYSTAEDLLKWDRALYGNKLLSEKSMNLLFDGGNEEFGYYGYGFRVQKYQRNPAIKTLGVVTRHGGMMDGFMSNFHHYLDDDLTVIILGNIRPFPIRNLSFEIKEIALGAELGTRNNSKLE